MAIIKPFMALRAREDIVNEVSCVPYDVINTDEAIKLAHGLPHSLLHVTRPEIDLPIGTDLHSDPVYAKAKETFGKFIENGILVAENGESLYVYEQTMQGRQQRGIVACTSVDEYDDGTIKKHERTRKDKEDDRTRHIIECSAQIEPVFLCHRRSNEIKELISKIVVQEPIYDFVSPDGVGHRLWRVNGFDDIAAFVSGFSKIPFLYIADGHHRSASASRVRAIKRDSNREHTGNEEYNFFLSVIFPEDELAILPYNRVVRDLNGYSEQAYLAAVAEKFSVVNTADKVPRTIATFSMYAGGRWYSLVPKSGSYKPSDPIASLDVSILQDNLLSPILGILDPRTDTRIDFVGGIRGVSELERLVDSGSFKVAFSLFPTTVQQLMDIADAGEIMPPKSTWFEPKLRSGLFIHRF